MVAGSPPASPRSSKKSSKKSSPNKGKTVRCHSARGSASPSALPSPVVVVRARHVLQEEAPVNSMRHKAVGWASGDVGALCWVIARRRSPVALAPSPCLDALTVARRLPPIPLPTR
jgi:hypothetical protein